MLICNLCHCTARHSACNVLWLASATSVLSGHHCWCSPAVSSFKSLLVAPPPLYPPPPPQLAQNIEPCCAAGHDRPASNDLGLCSRPDPLQPPSDPHQTHHETVLQKDLTAHLGSDGAGLHHSGCLHAAAEGPRLVPWCHRLCPTGMHLPSPICPCL